MTMFESIRMAWSSLRGNMLRTILTALGIIIGVAAVVALMGVGQGAQNSITSQLTSTGTNLLTITPGQTNTGGIRSAAGGAQTLTLEDSNAIPAACSVCAIVAPVYTANGAAVVYQSQNTNTSVTGVTPDFGAVRNLTVDSGDWFTTADVSSATNVVVLGATVATTLFQGEDPVGQNIRVNSLAFKVVGVLTAKGGAGFNSPDDAVYVPISTAQRKIIGARQSAVAGHSVSAIYVQVADKDSMDAAQSEITDLLRARHRITGDTNDFNVQNQADLLASLNSVIGILTAFLGSIAGISLLVGGIGIMNIMLVSVTERTREIGIRKAVGAREKDIMRQFLIESVTLSIGGGVLGILLGLLVAAIVSITGLVSAQVTIGSALLAVGFSAAVGMFFGIYPARRAARLDPIEALRYE